MVKTYRTEKQNLPGKTLRYCAFRKTVDPIVSRGIELKVERTAMAVETYNDLQGVKIVIAAFPSTC